MKKKAEKVILMGRMALLLCLIAALTLTSCATELSTRASRVYMVSAVQVHKVEGDCEYLGSVTGSSFFWGGCCLSYLAWRDVAYNNALNELLDNAAELGATHVFVNLGTGEGLRGDAYRCAYCRGPDGKPDMAYCRGPDGGPDIGYCIDSEGHRVGEAHCEGSQGENKAECEKNCGKWKPAIEEARCKAQKFRWLPKAENPDDCKTKGGTWIPVAKDQITCEGKGGTWVINTDVIRPEPAE